MYDESLFRLFEAGEETHLSKDYFFDNRIRPHFWGAPQCVIQRTVGGTCFFEEENGERKLAREGQALLYTQRENTLYGYPDGTEEPYHVRYLVFSKGVGTKEIFDLIRSRFGSVVSMPAGSESDSLFDQVFTGFKNRSVSNRWHEIELVHRLLLALLKEQFSETLERDPISRAHAFMSDRFRASVNLKDVASHCGISREHLCRMFRERYGVSPALFLRELRLKYGHMLLMSSRLLVEDIAVGCGYVHANAFARAYRRRYGKSPSEARIAKEQGTLPLGQRPRLA